MVLEKPGVQSLREPSDQGLFIHCFAFQKLSIILPNIIK